MSISFFTPGEDAPEEVNLANGNAARVLHLLGLPCGEWEMGGEATAEDFLGRILIAQALLDVATDDEHGRPDVTDGRFFFGGQRPGYLADRLAELEEVATWATRHGEDVIYWG
ncbi:hypothetical protein EDD29_0076 [Actinocorallia herbida]|uniref:Uncharacterized protein n=1 Tax=Actinocorallia herbida TaxID=58109 RepID=A0A3N1CN10_9ACTN|nr:hypothetical protein [Actinocorallia herbida]ROO82595.1 hypothetical protein EDD29_0076 [Actinocorallia herbida]